VSQGRDEPPAGRSGLEQQAASRRIMSDDRFLAMASSKGHVATFDWQAGKLSAEFQLREPVRDIKWV